MDDPQAVLNQQLKRAQIARRVSGFLIIAPVLVWVIALAYVMNTQHHPDDGFFVLAVLYNGLFATPLLIIPLIAFFIFSRRIYVLKRQVT